MEADTVFLDDGSVIHGEIKRLFEAELTIDVDFAPDIVIDLENIVTIETDRRITVRYRNGVEYSGYLWKDADGKAILKDNPRPQAAPDAHGADVPASSISAPGHEADDEEDGEKGTGSGALASAPTASGPAVIRVVDLNTIQRIKEYETFYRYNAEVEAGISAARGNTERSAYNFAAAFVPAFGKNTISLRGQVNREEADGDTVVSNWRAIGTYERELPEQWFVTGLNSYENDEKQNLDLRATLGIGGGRKIFDPVPTLLKVTLGAGWVHEEFERSSNPANVSPNFEGQRDYGAVLWVLEFYHDMYGDDVRFYHDHRLTGGVLGEAGLLALTTSGLKFELISDLSLKAEVQFDYNTDPGSDAKKHDERYLLKLSYEFEGDEDDWFQ